MRVTTVGILMMCVVIGGALFPGTASAQPSWSKYEVVGAGPKDNGEVMIQLKTYWGGDTIKWCHVADELEKTILAVALTAMSSDMPVRANLDFNATYALGREILGMYLVK